MFIPPALRESEPLGGAAAGNIKQKDYFTNHLTADTEQELGHFARA